MVTPDNEIDDDLTAKFMIRETIYVANGLEGEHIKELAEHPELMDKLSTVKQASLELLWGYGLWIPRVLAPFTLKGIVDALEAIREELQRLRKTKAKNSILILRIMDQLSKLVAWIASKIGK